MTNNKYLHVYKENELVKKGIDKCVAISRSFPLDDVNRLDISIFRFIRDKKTPFHYLVANMCYWYGKTNKEEELIQLLIENGSKLARLSKKSIELAQMMFKLGKTFPHWTEFDIQYIEKVWSLPKAFLWVDPIMYDSYELDVFCNFGLVRKRRYEINIPGYKALKREPIPYPKYLLSDVIKGFKFYMEPDFRPFYNRKTNKVSLHLPENEVSKDDFSFDYWIEYKDFNKFLTETYGERCAYIVANEYLLKESKQFDKKNFIGFITKNYGIDCSRIVKEQIQDGSINISKIPNKYKSFKEFLKLTGWLDVFAGFLGDIHRFQKSNYIIDPLSIFDITKQYFNDMALWMEREYIACWVASKYISFCKNEKTTD